MATIGLNIAGGEFGGTAGTHDQQYHYPTLSELQFYKDKGVDLVRLPFSWERVQDALGGSLDLTGDIALIKQVLVHAASLGMDVILDNHNYGRYNGVAIGANGGPTPAQFADFWQKMAIEFKDYPSLLGYDLMNEPHDMPVAGAWKAAAQAATYAIRSVDMDNVIYIEGEGWSGAHHWLQYNSDLIIHDPANKIVYQAHQYFDDNSSGTYDESYEGEGAYPMVGVDRLKPFVEWLKANDLRGMIGEFGVPSNDPRWLEVQKNVLDYMQANDLDGTAWAGGAWWPTNYVMYTAKPGQPDSAFMNLLEQHFSEYKDVFATSSPVAAEPGVIVNNVTGFEADGELVFTITRSGDLSKVSSVNYEALDGTAIAGQDYVATAGTITFAAGQATATVVVKLTKDTLVESSETLSLNLSGGTNVIIKDGQGVGTINSSDAGTGPAVPPGFPSLPTIIGSDNNDSINADGSRIDHVDAKGGDDVILGVGSQDFINGGAGSDTISYHWSGAHVDVDLLRASQQNGDANGDVLLNIENIVGSGHNDYLRGDDLANVINGMGGRDVMAGRAGSDRFVFNSAAHADGDLITDYTAADVLDFSAFSPKFLSITNDGVSTRIVGDANNDGIGDFTVTLQGVHASVNGVTLASPPPPQTLPAPPTVAINDMVVDERAGTVTFIVTRSGSLANPSSVNFATASNTATAGLDYVTVGGTINFAANETIKSVTITVINDTLVEGPETFFVNLSGGTNATISDAQGVGTINSEDVAAPLPPPSAPGTILGTANDDTISGTNNNDIIDALAGNDVVIGGGGADRLTGGAGSDRFVFRSAAEADGDVVSDFVPGFDKLDLSAIDANIFRRGNQDFTWLDTGLFTGLSGQLREYHLEGRHFVAGDNNGDGVADFTIEVMGAKDLTRADFLGVVNNVSAGTSKNWGSVAGFVDDTGVAEARSLSFHGSNSFEVATWGVQDAGMDGNMVHDLVFNYDKLDFRVMGDRSAPFDTGPAWSDTLNIMSQTHEVTTHKSIVDFMSYDFSEHPIEALGAMSFNSSSILW